MELNNFKNQFSVLFISSRADHGGGPKHLEQILQNLKSQIQCKVACPKDKPYWERIVQEIGVANVIEIPHRKFSLVHFLRLVRFIKKHQIKIVHSHGKGAGLYSRLLRLFCKIRVVHTYHGIHIGQYGKFKRIIYLRLERLLTIFTAKLICVSKSEADTVLKLRIASEHKIVVIQNGVVIPRLEQRDFPVLMNIVSITRFEFQKNTELIIPILENLRSLRGLDGIKIQLIGDGPNRQRLFDDLRMKGLEGSVEYIGLVPSPDEYLKNAFCYLSTSRWEGLPISLLEALAWGVPIIATNVEGNIDIVMNNQSGFLFPLNKPEEAARLIMKLSLSPREWKAMSDSSYIFCKQNYNVEIQCRKIYDLYLFILERD